MKFDKLKYFWNCLCKYPFRARWNCPSCGGSKSQEVARKKLVTTLRRCHRCALLFRTPTTTVRENAGFYQQMYRQGFDSDVPTPETLHDLLAQGFKGSPKDYEPYIHVLEALNVPKGARIFDFGCSWGYGTWQLQAAGYNVSGYEISRPRSSYARENLGIDTFLSLNDIPDHSFDVFFSAHVLEHVPSVAEAVELARKKLRPQGIFLAFTPNGSKALRNRLPELWNNLWGQVHPNFLDDCYYLKNFKQPLLMSSPYEYHQIRQWWESDTRDDRIILDGAELMAAVRLS
ncbi:MAG: class I SAM-dependent methyltransferase [Verrucomicrobiota bacterium]